MSFSSDRIHKLDNLILLPRVFASDVLGLCSGVHDHVTSWLSPQSGLTNPAAYISRPRA